ncbi:MAG TPA: co-chaperone GroES [Chitinophagales bacterium]|nr:co-chaperone GroES [Chitinophagales bacterium]HUM53078.1 co-chaperone GroES [Chitinophagales bacterium]
MIEEVNVDMVLIKPDPIPEESTGGIIAPDIARANAMKKQNRGIVMIIGSECKWAQVGWYVSFYKNAATDMPEDGEDFVIVHEGHVLAKFQTNVKK